MSKVVVITGASRGMGAEMARWFSQKGMSVATCARSSVKNAPAGLHHRCVDVQDGSALEAFCDEVVERFGNIDLWINNAGVLEPIAPLRSIAAADFSRVISINVLGVFNGSAAFIRHRRQCGGGGMLVNISSGAAQKGYFGWSAYCASKAAVDRMTEAIALEEAEQGLHAIALAPGVVDTAMQELIRATPEENFPAKERFLALKQNEHFNTPSYVAQTIFDMAFMAAKRPLEVVCRVPNQWES